MLSNAYFLAKFRFDTAEKEPAKKLQNCAEANPKCVDFANVRTRIGTAAPARQGRPGSLDVPSRQPIAHRMAEPDPAPLQPRGT